MFGHRSVLGVMTAAVLALSAGTAIGADDGLRFRGLGATRQTLDAMQLKPFDAANWAHLKDWSTPFNPESAGGKVVVIVTWAAWRAPSHPAMKAAQRVLDANKDKDLIVVGVHNPRGFDQAKANAQTLGVTFPIAADPDGKFREAIKADADPNVYVLDRAGHVRYAQLEPSSLEAAVTGLLAETTEQAKNLPTELASKKQAEEAARWRTGDAKATAGAPARVEFELPDEDAYKRVKWPYQVGKVERDKILERISVTPPVVTLPEENWYPSKPDTHGRLVAMYITDPVDTALMNVVPVMNNISTRYWGEVVVVGQAAKVGEAVMNVSGEEEAKLTERNTAAIKTVLAQNRLNHPMQAAPFKGEQFEGDIPIFGLERGLRNAGVVMLLSTDNKVRWMGNPYSDEFRRAIQQLLEIDPGVAARKKAEAAKKK